MATLKSVTPPEPPPNGVAALTTGGLPAGGGVVGAGGVVCVVAGLGVGRAMRLAPIVVSVVCGAAWDAVWPGWAV